MCLPRRMCKARALPVFHLDTCRAHAIVEQESNARRRVGPAAARQAAKLDSLVRAVYRAATAYADAFKFPAFKLEFTNSTEVLCAIEKGAARMHSSF